MPNNTTLRAVLAQAVESIGGQSRAGQLEMASSIRQALVSRTHLLVQAGTGTGKSLGYLVPCLLSDEKVVVATATLALQNQLISKDIPTVLSAIEKVTGERKTVEIFKGRSNYACLQKVRFSTAELQTELISADKPTTELGRQVVQLRDWAEEQIELGGLGDRDDAPAHSPKAWDQVSVRARQCVGATKCPMGKECLIEKAYARARVADLIITNHALLALDVISENSLLPDHGVTVIDEAHELVSRMTTAASCQLSPAHVAIVGKAGAKWISDEVATEFASLSISLADALAKVEPGILSDSSTGILEQVQLVSVLSRKAISQLSGQDKTSDLVERGQALALAEELFEFCERISSRDPKDVVWVAEIESGRQLVAAPLSVTDLMREGVLAQSTTILTSATLTLGGKFDSIASSVGLFHVEKISNTDLTKRSGLDQNQRSWSGIDVGSPFDYQKQGILYIGKSLPKPGRSSLPDQVLTQIVALINAADGRTLGLFSSRRAAEEATTYVRQALPELPVLSQWDGNISHLTRQFRSEAQTCLFGTLSLWQGVDAPGDACRLVIIDKIPFPPPDDPLTQARQLEVNKHGGNGFMQVSATEAGVKLAQGAGRLIRSLDDRGVVACLDPRLATARYGSFLRNSMPDFWTTDDFQLTLAALKRLTK